MNENVCLSMIILAAILISPLTAIAETEAAVLSPGGHSNSSGQEVEMLLKRRGFSESAVSEDYDSGKKSYYSYDIADGAWNILKTTQGHWTSHYGYPGTVPVHCDYDGDGECDIGVYNALDGAWNIYKSSEGHWATNYGYLGTVPVPADYDGDGKCDIGVYDDSNGAWNIFKSTEGQYLTFWGYSGAIPVPGDYDGDGKDDIGVYADSNGAWNIYRSTEGEYSTSWGYSGTVPVPGDYDGDGKDDIGVYHDHDGAWKILLSDPETLITNYGYAGTVPVQGDFDGDGTNDFGVYYADDGMWHIYKSTEGEYSKLWSSSGAVPVPGDYDGDGICDIGVYTDTNGRWAVLRSSTGGGWETYHGYPGTVPVQGDYDGDGKTDFGVYEAGNGAWNIKLSGGGTLAKGHGYAGTVPVQGDYDGDGKDDIGVYEAENGAWNIILSGGGTLETSYGYVGTVPVQGDYDGDGKDDIGVYADSNGAWNITLSGGGTLTRNHGDPGMVPVQGDYDGDGKDDIGVYRAQDGEWNIILIVERTLIRNFGYPGTVPVQGDYDGDGIDDTGIYDTRDGVWNIYKSSDGHWATNYGYPGTVPVPGDYDGDGKFDIGVYDAMSDQYDTWYGYTINSIDNKPSGAINTDLPTIQHHSLHESNDVDWVKFYAVTNYVYDIETTHYGNNIDTVIELHKGHLDNITDTNFYIIKNDFGNKQGEHVQFNPPGNAVYYVRVSHATNNQVSVSKMSAAINNVYYGPGDYQLKVSEVNTENGLKVFTKNRYMPINRLNESTTLTISDGSGIVTTGITSADSVFNCDACTNADVNYEVSVVPPENCYKFDHPSNPFWSHDKPSSNNSYANPIYVNMYTSSSEDVFVATKAVTMYFTPYVIINGKVIAEDGSPIPHALITLEYLEYIEEDIEILCNNTYHEMYPIVSYGTNIWFTDSVGDFPTNIYFPAIPGSNVFELMVQAYGYEPFVTNVEVYIGKNADLGNIILTAAPPDSIEVHGKVKDMSGNVVEDASVRIVDHVSVTSFNADINGWSAEPVLLNPNHPHKITILKQEYITYVLTNTYPFCNNRSYPTNECNGVLGCVYELGAILLLNDTNNNEIPDCIEGDLTEIIGNPTNIPECLTNHIWIYSDHDGDGTNNWQELLASLNIEVGIFLHENSNAITLQWPANTNYEYDVQVSTDLLNEEGWTSLEENLIFSNENGIYINSLSETNSFFRIGITP